jgi:hypothetical protein
VVHTSKHLKATFFVVGSCRTPTREGLIPNTPSGFHHISFVQQRNPSVLNHNVLRPTSWFNTFHVSFLRLESRILTAQTQHLQAIAANSSECGVPTLAIRHEGLRLSSPDSQAVEEPVQIVTILQYSSRHNWRASLPNTAGIIMLVNGQFACLLRRNEVRRALNYEILERQGHPCTAACPPGTSTRQPTS